MAGAEDLARIREALALAAARVRELDLGSLQTEMKGDDDPVTIIDRAVDEVLRVTLPRDGEGWLSEETIDDHSRLEARRVWVVDPVDGTRELVAGVPEWCISVGLVEDGVPTAGGIYNPRSDELFLGGPGLGLTYNDEPVPATPVPFAGAVVLASRSEVRRGEWERFDSAPFTVKVTGSVAYKLALVAAGKASATWTLVPKSEWDVAAGVALLAAAGLHPTDLHDQPLRFNQAKPLFPGVIATPSGSEWAAFRATLMA